MGASSSQEAAPSPPPPQPSALPPPIPSALPRGPPAERKPRRHRPRTAADGSRLTSVASNTQLGRSSDGSSTLSSRKEVRRVAARVHQDPTLPPSATAQTPPSSGAPRCYVCTKAVDLPKYECHFCHKYICKEHRNKKGVFSCYYTCFPCCHVVTPPRSSAVPVPSSAQGSPALGPAQPAAGRSRPLDFQLSARPPSAADDGSRSAEHSTRPPNWPPLSDPSSSELPIRFGVQPGDDENAPVPWDDMATSESTVAPVAGAVPSNDWRRPGEAYLTPEKQRHVKEWMQSST